MTLQIEACVNEITAQTDKETYDPIYIGDFISLFSLP